MVAIPNLITVSKYSDNLFEKNKSLCIKVKEMTFNRIRIQLFLIVIKETGWFNSNQQTL